MPGEAQQVSYEGLVAQGRAAYHALRLDEALERYRAALTSQPQGYEAQVGLAQTLGRMRRQEEGYAAAEKSVALDAGRYEGYVVLGMLHFLTDHLGEAESVLKKAIALAPSEPEPHLTLAQVYADTKQFEAARAELDVARELIANRPDERERLRMTALAWQVQAYQRLAEGKTAEAIESAQEAIALEEVSPYAASLAYANLGILEARARRYDQAIEYLDHAFRMNPYFQRAGGALGRILILRGQPTRAAEVLAQVLSTMPPGNGPTRYAYAMALARSKRREEALAQYRQALQEGLTGSDALLARWQTIWLSAWGRNLIIALVLAAVMVWILAARPSPQTLTLVVLLAAILILQRTVGRRRR